MGKSFSAGMYDDKLQEIMKLLDEQGEEASEATQEEAFAQTKEDLIRELTDGDAEEALTKNQSAFVEYSMMMKQWEALMEDYERREAEEAAEGSVD